jgi:hypothetical protein
MAEHAYEFGQENITQIGHQTDNHLKCLDIPLYSLSNIKNLK